MLSKKEAYDEEHSNEKNNIFLLDWNNHEEVL
jgi:hypothetical protein